MGQVRRETAQAGIDRCTGRFAGLSVGMALWLLSPAAEAASTRVCVYNSGNAHIQVAAAYKSEVMGWTIHGWFDLPPGKRNSCAWVRAAGSSSDEYYFAVWQLDDSGKGAFVAVDAVETQRVTGGGHFTGGTYVLRPRPTVRNPRDPGATFTACVLNGGNRDHNQRVNRGPCRADEVLSLFTAKIYTPTSGGGFFDTYRYDVHIASDRNAARFAAADLYKPTTLGLQPATARQSCSAPAPALTSELTAVLEEDRRRRDRQSPIHAEGQCAGLWARFQRRGRDQCDLRWHSLTYRTSATRCCKSTVVPRRLRWTTRRVRGGKPRPAVARCRDARPRRRKGHGNRCSARHAAWPQLGPALSPGREV
jgi:hypothetical protein